jgi:hypothetical protein
MQREAVIDPRIYTLFIAVILIITIGSAVYAQNVEAMKEFNIPDTEAFFEGTAGDTNFGVSIGNLGDVNGDGIDDMIIGSNWAYSHYTGKAFVVFGKEEDRPRITSDNSLPWSFKGETMYDKGGAIVAGAGDVNGDGLNDILISAPDDDEPHGYQSGQTYLIFGRTSGWGKNISLESSNASFHAQGLNAGKATEASGCSIDGVGDVNGDGYDDFVIGASGYSEKILRQGKTYLILGKPDGWSMDTNLSQADASFVGRNSNEMSGSKVSGLGDVNGDGYDDFMIASPHYKTYLDGDLNGKVYVIFGKKDGWENDVELAFSDASFIGNASGDRMGYDIDGIGDINGDGFDDIALGSLMGDRYIVLGKETGWKNDVHVHDVDIFIPGRGYISGVGDVNSDGYVDIVIGHMHFGTHNYQDTYLFKGGADRWSAVMSFSDADAEFKSNWGKAWKAGDLNNDGFDDIAFGDPKDSATIWGGGVVYLVYYTTIPPPPVNLTCTLSGDGENITLKWDQVEGSFLENINIYRSLSGDVFHQISTIDHLAGSFVDDDVWLHHNYHYYITVENDEGIESNRSEIAWVFNDIDTDGDGVGNIYDTDDDGDNVTDARDMFPLNISEWIDSDLDGMGNNIDPDDDNDGIPDLEDAEPLVPINGILDILEIMNISINEIRDDESIIEMLEYLNSSIEENRGSLEEIADEINAFRESFLNDLDELFIKLNGTDAELSVDLEELRNRVNYLNFSSHFNETIMPGIMEMLTALSEDMAGVDEQLSEEILLLRSNFSDHNELMEDRIGDLEGSNAGEDTNYNDIFLWILVVVLLIAVMILGLLQFRNRTAPMKEEKPPVPYAAESTGYGETTPPLDPDYDDAM